jgi:hypothetical protein
MHLQQIRDHQDLHLDDLDRRDVELHQLMDLSCDMDQMLVHLLHLDVVQNLDELDHRHRQDVVHLVVQQNLVVVRLVVVRLDALRPLVAVVDVELRHLLRMDYFLDAVDVEQPHLQRMDYFRDAVRQELVVLPVLLEQLAHLELQCVQLQLMQQLALPHVMP